MPARCCHALSFLTAVVIGLSLPMSTPAAPVTIEPDAELERLIGEREVVFFARDLDGDRAHAYAPGRIDERHPPLSTFKIPNFLIALETGVIEDPDAMHEWNPEARPPNDFWPDSWKQSQSLMTGFRRSAIWLFRDIAVAVGGERYRSALSRFDYGNHAAADGNDGFWLDGSLRISPREQVDFLSRMLEGELGIAPEHLEQLSEASLLTRSGACRLNGKTGAGPQGEDFDGPFEGWLAGWTQCGQSPPTVFALWVRGPSFGAIRTFRQDFVTELLQRIGAFAPREADTMENHDHTHHAIDYIEIPVTDLARAKRFYGEAFGWSFNDYGDQYVGIRRPGESPQLESGGFRPEESVTPGGVLIILYSEDLEASLDGVRAAGGEVTAEPFSFPGGRRFQFRDPDGHELAVWSSE